MSSTTFINGNIQTTQSSQIPNLDIRYGPYNNTTEVLNALAQPGDILAANGLTVGVWENGNVVDYVFVNIVEGETPTISNLIRKIETPNLAHVVYWVEVE